MNGTRLTEEPQRRLVTGKHFLRLLLAKAGLYSTAVVIGCGGIVCLAGALFIPILGTDSYAKRFHPDEITLMGFYCLSGLSGALFLGAMAAATTLVKKMNKMEPVSLLTCRNANHLPEAETLVRGSNLPLTIPETELLRAAGSGLETPATQLLRAGRDHFRNG